MIDVHINIPDDDCAISPLAFKIIGRGHRINRKISPLNGYSMFIDVKDNEINQGDLPWDCKNDDTD